MKNLHLDYSKILPFIKSEEIKAMEKVANESRLKLLNKTGLGNEFLGWVNYGSKLANEEVEAIIKTSEEIKAQNDVLLVIGIGGSFLGAKAALDMLKPYFNNDSLEIIFAGNTFSSAYTAELLTYLQDKDFAINVISKSGTTTEPALAFRIFKDLLEKKYGNEAYKRIYATTDATTGKLKQMADNEGYRTFSIPKDIGGRYSVITAVGLLPMACSNIDIMQVINGVRDAEAHFQTAQFINNEALLYASIRNLLYQKDKDIELFVIYEPKHRYFLEWLKQLFGESEGKDGKGLFPASTIYSTDLHAMGQYIQDGQKIIFETSIKYLSPEQDIQVPNDVDNKDGLNYLSNKSLDYINSQAFAGVVLAHVEGDVPNMIIEMPVNDAYHFGYLVYFFLFSCAVSGYILGVNPFDQEGVETYKRNMFALLGKQGYEDIRKKLESIDEK